MVPLKASNSRGWKCLNFLKNTTKERRGLVGILTPDACRLAPLTQRIRCFLHTPYHLQIWKHGVSVFITRARVVWIHGHNWASQRGDMWSGQLCVLARIGGHPWECVDGACRPLQQLLQQHIWHKDKKKDGSVALFPLRGPLSQKAPLRQLGTAAAPGQFNNGHLHFTARKEKVRE